MNRTPLAIRRALTARIFIAAAALAMACGAAAQDSDSLVIASIYREALNSHAAYDNLRALCKDVGGRLTGSPAAAAAVELTSAMLAAAGADTVSLQPLTVPRWFRGEKETAFVDSERHGQVPVHVCALGGSVGTGPGGLRTGVVEVAHIDSLAVLADLVKGRIVFFNRRADQSYFNTFRSYSGAVDQRISGAARAALYGAAGVVVRSVTTALDTVPHTGILRYEEEGQKIPAVAISTADADLLSAWLRDDPGLQLFIRTACERREEVQSFNVIGELAGSDFPDEYITVGGHLDSWDLGEGAHDDGAGCIQAIEVLRLFRELGIRPRHTLRVVMFMDEEVAQTGSSEYARQAEAAGERHFLALEADHGGFTPSGFTIDVPAPVVDHLRGYEKYFVPYQADRFIRGGSGPDIWRLKELGAVTAGLVVDSQRYFDYHHSAKDVFGQVNRRELQLGSAAMAAFVYLLDRDESLEALLKR